MQKRKFNSSFNGPSWIFGPIWKQQNRPKPFKPSSENVAKKIEQVIDLSTKHQRYLAGIWHGYKSLY